MIITSSVQYVWHVPSKQTLFGLTYASRVLHMLMPLAKCLICLVCLEGCQVFIMSLGRVMQFTFGIMIQVIHMYFVFSMTLAQLMSAMSMLHELLVHYCTCTTTLENSAPEPYWLLLMYKQWPSRKGGCRCNLVYVWQISFQDLSRMWYMLCGQTLRKLSPTADQSLSWAKYLNVSVTLLWDVAFFCRAFCCQKAFKEVTFLGY